MIGFKKLFSLFFVLVFVVNLKLCFGTDCSEEENLPKESHSLRVLSIPEKANTVNLDKNFGLHKKLDKIFSYLKKRQNPEKVPFGLRVESMTPEEAKKYFSSYIQKKCLPESDEEFRAFFDPERDLFTDRFFGMKPLSSSPATPQEIFEKKDPYIAMAIINYAKSLKELRAIEDIEERNEKKEFLRSVFEKKQKKISVLSLLLTREEIAKEIVREESKKASAWSFYKRISDSPEALIHDYPEIFYPDGVGIPEDEIERETFFEEASIGILSQKMLDNIYRTARSILEVTKPEDTLLIFGNTPYFVGRALKQITMEGALGKEEKQNIIMFPFSGSPNRIRPGSFPDLKNLVTENRLRHLQKRMREVGLWPRGEAFRKNGTLHIVDVYGSGSGPAYFIEELLRNFQKEKETFPSIKLISLNEIDIEDEEDQRNASISKRSAKDGEVFKFHFPSISRTHYKIGGQVIYLPGNVMLDNLHQDEWRGFPNYNPAYWVSDYDTLVEEWQNQKHTKTLFEFFDLNMKKRIASGRAVL